MCPVHTPDGAPCGLLNHLAAPCELVVLASDDEVAFKQAVVAVLTSAGMVPASPGLTLPTMPQHIPVMLDGGVVGSVRAAAAASLVLAVRRFKARTRVVPLLVSSSFRLDASVASSRLTGEAGQRPRGALPGSRPYSVLGRRRVPRRLPLFIARAIHASCSAAGCRRPASRMQRAHWVVRAGVHGHSLS